MNFVETKLSGSFLITPEPQEDDRGFFSRIFCQSEFSQRGLNTVWAQVNNSLSIHSRTLRGLHFQLKPHSEVKLVRCIQGSIWDVIVDLRLESPNFGSWFGVKLSAHNRKMVYVPKGFAHGFISLEPNSEILYLVSDFYEPQYEQTLLWNDSEVSIKWPSAPILVSEKDSRGKTLNQLKSLMRESYEY